MAGEIKVQIFVDVTNGNYKTQFNPGQVSIDQGAVGGHAPIISVGTSEEAVSFGDIATLGCVALRNLDGTNYVDIGPDSGGSMVPMIRLKPGEVAFLRLKPGITVKAQANTSAVKVQMMALEA